jgi:ketosteroid isomerase-like protein
MITRRLLLVAGFISVLAAVSLAGAKNRTSSENALRAADAEWMKVFAAKDLDKSVGFCDEDGAVLAPNSPIAQGHAAISKLFSGFFGLPGLKISWHADAATVARSGDLGYTSGTYQMTFNDPSGKTISDNGKYVTVWQKQSDGSWKVVRDIFNTDLPAPGGP